MKKIIVLAIVVLGITVAATAQTLRVANNNPGVTAGTNTYIGATALQDAIAAAVAGDVIYVVPSSTSYGSITIDKSLTLFGIGIRPQRDLAVLSKVGFVTIGASDVRISGMGEVGELYLGSTANPTPNNILIENNVLIGGVRKSAITGVSIGNLIIRNNILTSSVFLWIYDSAPLANITNNVFFGGTAYGGGIACDNVMFYYNIFTNVGDADIFDRVSNTLFDHNIFYGVRVDMANIDPTYGINNTWNYNLAYGNTVSTYNVFELVVNGNSGIGNLESTGTGNLDPLFVNLPLTTTWSKSYDFTLQTGSPALATDPLNLSTEDIGPSGGFTPFDFEGNILPLIQSIILPAVIPVGTDLPVTIKAKGN